MEDLAFSNELYSNETYRNGILVDLAFSNELYSNDQKPSVTVF